MRKPSTCFLSTHFFVAAAILGLCSVSLQAATISFTLEGNDGSGLLPGNENPPVTGNGPSAPGSGGLGSGGISFDTVSKVLSIDVFWGSSNPTSLTGDATSMHIHLATAAAPAGFSQNAAASITLSALTGFTASASNGGFVGDTPALSGSQEAALLGNQSYINVHTAANTGGEIRGHLVAVPPVPEPASILLAGLGLFGLITCGRRSK